ncbi:uncharacterized protein KZ484_012399 [Pholidichthys leucotaenia]
MVMLKWSDDFICRDDLVTALKHFGKTKSIVVFRKAEKAVVCFQEEEDARKLKAMKSLTVKGDTIFVVKEEDAAPEMPLPAITKEQTQPPQKDSAKSSISVPRPSNRKAGADDSKVKSPLKESKTNAKKVVAPPEGTIMVDEFSSPPLVEPLKDTKRDIVENVLTEIRQQPKTEVDGLSERETVIKENVEEAAAKISPAPSESALSENNPDGETFKLQKVDLEVGEPALVLKDSIEVNEESITAATELKHQVELARADVEAKEVKNIESSPDSKREQLTTQKALPDKSSKSQPLTSSVKATPDISPPKPPTDSPHMSKTTLEAPQTLVKASPRSQAGAQMPKQMTGVPAEVAQEANQTAKQVETTTNQESETPGTLIRPSPQTQESLNPDPESSAQGKMQQHSVKTSTEVSMETDKADKTVETIKNQIGMLEN